MAGVVASAAPCEGSGISWRPKVVIDEAVSSARAPRGVYGPIGCFVAETLVHTKQGLVPIDQIKVGDWVLSQPEAAGARSYKPVANTFRFEAKQVYVVKWYTAAALAAARQANPTVPLQEFHATVVTGNHPFWVKGRGWTEADHLANHNELELADGHAALVSTIDKVYRTTLDNVGWVRGRGIDDDYGRLLDLRGGRIDLGQDRVLNEGVDWWDGDQWFQPAVYNLEVDDNHTYYVDTLGVWVHNTDCGGDVGNASAARQQRRRLARHPASELYVGARSEGGIARSSTLKLRSTRAIMSGNREYGCMTRACVHPRIRQ